MQKNIQAVASFSGKIERTPMPISTIMSLKEILFQNINALSRLAIKAHESILELLRVGQGLIGSTVGGFLVLVNCHLIFTFNYLGTNKFAYRKIMLFGDSF